MSGDAPRALDRIREIAEGLVRDESEVVVACGSIIEGFGNAGSDIDLLVVADDEGPAPEVPDGPLELAVLHDMLGIGDDDLVDVEWAPRDYLDRLITRVNALTPGTRTVSEIIDLEQYYRFGAGMVVVNEAGYRETRARFSLEHLGLLLMTDADSRTALHVAQTESHLAAGLADSAAESAKNALSWALHGYLFERGDRFPPRKWRYEKLARLCGADHPYYERAWRLKAPAGTPPERYVSETLAFVRTLRPELATVAPASSGDPDAEGRKELLMAELRYCKDLADFEGAVDADQPGMAFHALGRVSERLRDAWLVRRALRTADPRYRARLLRDLADAGDEVAARIRTLTECGPASTAQLRELREACREVGDTVGFRLFVPPTGEAVTAFYADASAVFRDLDEFRTLNYLASAGVSQETGANWSRSRR